jgi:hypothetical protein
MHLHFPNPNLEVAQQSLVLLRTSAVQADMTEVEVFELVGGT